MGILHVYDMGYVYKMGVCINVTDVGYVHRMSISTYVYKVGICLYNLYSVCISAYLWCGLSVQGICINLSDVDYVQRVGISVGYMCLIWVMYM